MGEKINCMLNEGKIGEGKGRKFASKMGVNALKADLSGCVWGFLCSLKKKRFSDGRGDDRIAQLLPLFNVLLSR